MTTEITTERECPRCSSPFLVEEREGDYVVLSCGVCGLSEEQPREEWDTFAGDEQRQREKDEPEEGQR